MQSQNSQLIKVIIGLASNKLGTAEVTPPLLVSPYSSKYPWATLLSENVDLSVKKNEKRNIFLEKFSYFNNILPQKNFVIFLFKNSLYKAYKRKLLGRTVGIFQKYWLFSARKIFFGNFENLVCFSFTYMLKKWLLSKGTRRSSIFKNLSKNFDILKTVIMGHFGNNYNAKRDKEGTYLAFLVPAV